MFHTLGSSNKSPWLGLIQAFALVALGAFSGHWLGFKFASIGAEDSLITEISLTARRPLLIIQASTAIGAFIIGPLFYLVFFSSLRLQRLFLWKHSYIPPLLLALGLTLSFMVVNTWFIQWNIAFKFPIWLRNFEIGAQHQEAIRLRLTHLLTTFHSPQELIIGIVVIGLIPAVGEELLFRGVIQPLCHQITNNIHGAIAVSAFAFSAIHLQFYGLVPRFLLGMLFGYIYWWTKDLTFSMVAHFFNNVFTLLLIFLHQQGAITHNILTPVVLPKSVLLFFALLTIVLAHYLRRLHKNSYL